MHHRRRLAAERCETVTPFGRPVDPDVNNVYNAASPDNDPNRSPSDTAATDTSTDPDASTSTTRTPSPNSTTAAGTAPAATTTTPTPAVPTMYSTRSTGA